IMQLVGDLIDRSMCLFDRFVAWHVGYLQLGCKTSVGKTSELLHPLQNTEIGGSCPISVLHTMSASGGRSATNTPPSGPGRTIFVLLKPAGARYLSRLSDLIRQESLIRRLQYGPHSDLRVHSNHFEQQRPTMMPTATERFRISDLELEAHHFGNDTTGP